MELLDHVALIARSSPVSASIAAHIDLPAVRLLRGLAHRDQPYPLSPTRRGPAMWRWGAYAFSPISFRLNMSRVRIIPPAPSSGWSEMELNMAVPVEMVRPFGLI